MDYDADPDRLCNDVFIDLVLDADDYDPTLITGNDESPTADDADPADEAA